MKEQYIKQVEKELSLPRKMKKEVVRDLNEVFASAMEHGETEQQIIQRLGTPREFADSTAEQFGIDVNDEQLKLATEMGADLAINSRTEDAARIVQEKAGGAHAAVVTAVAKAAFNSAVDAVRAGGRVVAVGLPPESMSLDIPRLVLDGIEVVGSLVGTRQDLTEAFQFAAEGKVVPKVALRPLADINTIFTEMEEGKIRGRMVIDFRR